MALVVGCPLAGHATVTVTEHSLVGDNTATNYSGGGILCGANSSVTVSAGSRVARNTEHGFEWKRRRCRHV